MMDERTEADSSPTPAGEMQASEKVVASREVTLREFAQVLGQLMARRWLRQQSERCESAESERSVNP